LASALGDDLGDKIAGYIYERGVLANRLAKPNKIASGVVSGGIVLPNFIPESCCGFAIGMR
jgi:hypothetical protein